MMLLEFFQELRKTIWNDRSFHFFGGLKPVVAIDRYTRDLRLPLKTVLDLESIVSYMRGAVLRIETTS